MADKQTIADRYEQAMRIHGHGYGLYHTASCRDIRPGVCGYVDSTGVWQHIVDLGDKKALEREGYTQIGHLVKGKSAEEVWEEITSEGVSSKKVEANVGGDAGPVGARIHFSLDSSTKDGAVLLCNTSVFREGYRDEGILWKWGKANAKAILKNRPDVKQYGFYVVKATWVTEDVWVNAWTDSEKDISIGFDVHAAGHGELAPKIQYKKGHSAGGWVHPVPKVEVCRSLFHPLLIVTWLTNRSEERRSRETGNIFQGNWIQIPSCGCRDRRFWRC
jgi:hypothetical protein